MSAPVHIPVLLPEVLAALGDVKGKLVADGTFGGGGHTRALLAAGAAVVATDWDAAAVSAGEANFAAEIAAGQLILHHAPYDALPEILEGQEVTGILLDLGFSSDQLDNPARGLSYHAEGPLDMRLNSDLKHTAADLLNELREEALADIFYQFGEEPRSRVLARAIVAQRKTKPYATTIDLLETIESLYPKRLGKNSGQHRAHPAARIFQALRVAVNDEMAVLERALTGCAYALGAGGVLAVITFQPLEERMVKQIFRSLAVTPLDEVGRVAGVAPFTLGKKITPSSAELALNPRARSATLRTIRRATQ